MLAAREAVPRGGAAAAARCSPCWGDAAGEPRPAGRHPAADVAAGGGTAGGGRAGPVARHPGARRPGAPGALALVAAPGPTEDPPSEDVTTAAIFALYGHVCLDGLGRRALLAPRRRSRPAALPGPSPGAPRPGPPRRGLPIVARPFHPLLVPVPPGGSVDPLARLIGRHLGEALGQPVVVENHAGAGGNIAFEMVARARPDGTTLLVGWDSLAINPALFPRVEYDPLRDFAPIIQTVRTAQLLVVRPGLPAADLAGFLALAARRRLTLGSPGNGSIGHLAAALLQARARARARAGAEWTHVPYKGGGPALADLIAGHIDAVSLTLPAATEHVRAGRIRAIAVTTAARAPALPEVPTVAESGFPGFDVTSWQGLLAPAGTDPAIIARLNAEVARILARPEVAVPLAAQGFEPVGGAAAVLADRLAADVPRWPAAVALAGARVDSTQAALAFRVVSCDRNIVNATAVCRGRRDAGDAVARRLIKPKNPEILQPDPAQSQASPGFAANGERMASIRIELI